MDLAQSLLALGAVLSPLVAAAFVAALRARQSGAWFAIGGAMVSSLCAVLSILRTVPFQPEPQYGYPLGIWLHFPSLGALTISLGVRWDLAGQVLIAAISLATACAFAWEGNSELATPRLRIGGCLLLFAAVGAILSTNLGSFFVFWQIGAAAAYFVATSAISPFEPEVSTPRAIAARRFILVQLVGGSLLLGALFAIAAGAGSLDFDRAVAGFQIPSNGNHVAGAKGALLDFIGLCLLGAVAARCGMFPLFGWVDDLGSGAAVVQILLQASCLAPIGAVLLLRCLPLITAAEHSSATAAFLAAGSSLLAAVCARGAFEPRRKTTYACLSVLLFVLFGLFSAGEWTGLDQTLLLTAFIILSTAVVAGVSAMSASAEEEFRNESDARRALRNRTAIRVSAGLLFSGICGQGRLLAAMVLAVATGEVPRLLFGFATLAAGYAEFLAAMSIARALRETRQPELTSGPDRPGRLSRSASNGSHERQRWLLPTLTVCGLLVALTAVAAPAFANDVDRARSWVRDTAATLIVCVPGIGGLYLGSLPRERSRFSEETLTRLGRARFYAEPVLFLSLLLPLRAAAQLTRFADWFLVESFITGFPVSLAQSAIRVFEPVQRRGAGFYMTAAGVGTGVLAGVIVWLRS